MNDIRDEKGRLVCLHDRMVLRLTMSGLVPKAMRLFCAGCGGMWGETRQSGDKVFIRLCEHGSLPDDCSPCREMAREAAHHA